MKNKVIVIIVNWNRYDDTVECIQSVLNSDYPYLHLLLIDNGSSDEVFKKIKQEFTNIETIRLKENIGFAKAYNIGFKYAIEHGFTDILILNNDVVVHPYAIRFLMSAKSSIAVPKILYYENNNIIWSAGAKWKTFPPRVIIDGFKKKDNPKYNQEKNLQFATACALLVKSEVISKIGGFDEDYISYFEDYDFTCRASRAGYKIAYVPKAIVFHKVSRSLGENSYAKWYYLGRNSFLFYKKNNFPLSFSFYFLVWVMLRELFKMNFRSIIPFVRGAYFAIREIKG